LLKSAAFLVHSSSMALRITSTLLLSSGLGASAACGGHGAQTVDDPREFPLCLASAIAGNLSGEVTVATYINGKISDATDDYLDGRGVNFTNEKSAYISWFSDSSTLEMLLNDRNKGCRGMTQTKCACNYFVAASMGQPDWTTHWRFLTANVSLNNETTGTSKSPVVNMLSPTWDALFDKVVPDSFQQILGVVPCHPAEDGDNFTSISTELERYSSDCFHNATSGFYGCRYQGEVYRYPFQPFYHEHRAEMSKYISCSADPQEDPMGDTFVNSCAMTELAQSIETYKNRSICTDLALVRAYVWKFMDCMPQFYGTGRNEGGPEYFSVPNEPLAQVVTATGPAYGVFMLDVLDPVKDCPATEPIRRLQSTSHAALRGVAAPYHLL